MVILLGVIPITAVAQPGELTQPQLVAALTGTGDAGRDGVRSSAPQRRRAAGLLADALQAAGLKPQLHEYRRPNINGLVDLLLAPYRGINVYARVAASRPDKATVIVGAHYDTEPGTTGADDNASGVALVYALAVQVSNWPQRNLNYLFVFFDQEEDDEVGSKAFADFIAAQDLAVHSVHIADMVGWDADGDRAVEVQDPGPLLQPHYRAAAESLGIPVHFTGGASSDTRAFRQAGFPTAGVWEEYYGGDFNPHYHSPGDVMDTLDFEYLASTTRLVLATLQRLDKAGNPDG